MFVNELGFQAGVPDDQSYGNAVGSGQGRVGGGFIHVAAIDLQGSHGLSGETVVHGSENFSRTGVISGEKSHVIGFIQTGHHVLAAGKAADQTDAVVHLGELVIRKVCAASVGI